MSVAKSDTSVAKDDKDVAFNEKARKLCMTLWPGRTAAPQLAIHGDIDVRQAQRILGRTCGFSLKVYRSLLHSPYGGSFFDLMMHGASADWVRDTWQERKISEKRRQKRELEKQLKELEGA